eukprot:4731632-Alexandrium_andersonii.AAC.1
MRNQGRLPQRVLREVAKAQAWVGVLGRTLREALRAHVLGVPLLVFPVDFDACFRVVFQSYVDCCPPRCKRLVSKTKAGRRTIELLASEADGRPHASFRNLQRPCKESCYFMVDTVFAREHMPMSDHQHRKDDVVRP